MDGVGPKADAVRVWEEGRQAFGAEKLRENGSFSPPLRPLSPKQRHVAFSASKLGPSPVYSSQPEK